MKESTGTTDEWRERLDLQRSTVGVAERALTAARVAYQTNYFRLKGLGEAGAAELTQLRDAREQAARELAEAQEVLSATERELAIALERDGRDALAVEWDAFNTSADQWLADADELQKLAMKAGPLLARLVSRGKELRLGLPRAAKEYGHLSYGSAFFPERLIGDFGRQIYVSSDGAFVPKLVNLVGSVHETALRPNLHESVLQVVKHVRSLHPAQPEPAPTNAPAKNSVKTGRSK